jgi:hypothetical protein
MANGDNLVETFLVDDLLEVLREELETVRFCVRRLGCAIVAQTINGNDAVVVGKQIVPDGILERVRRIWEAGIRRRVGLLSFAGLE